MSRPTRILQKRFIVFCEGDTEYNYIDHMRKKQGVHLVLKPINMRGGGYSNFLNQGNLSYEVMMNGLEGKKKLISNKYEIKKKNFEISITKTTYNSEMHDRKCSNMEEFFKVIDW